MVLQEIHTHSPQIEFENDGDPDRVYIPARAVLSAIRNNGLAIMPDVREIHDYLKDFFSILAESANQNRSIDTIFVEQPDEVYLLDDAITRNIEYVYNELITRFSQGQNFALHPYANNPYLRRWVGLLESKGLNFEIMQPEKLYYPHWSNRGGWSRDILQPERRSIPERLGIPYATGFTVLDPEQAKSAFDIITDEKLSSEFGVRQSDGVVAKAVFSSGGGGIGIIESIEDLAAFYNALTCQGLHQLGDAPMPIEIQPLLPIAGIYSTQFENGQVITPGRVSVQDESANSWTGNVFNTHIPLEVTQAADVTYGAYFQYLHEHAPIELQRSSGGFDIVQLEGGESLVLEPNLGRPTGATSAIETSAMLGVKDKPFMSIKVPGVPVSKRLKHFWAELDSSLKFDNITKTGVFPLTWVTGCHQVLLTADTPEELKNLHEQFLTFLNVNSLVSDANS